MAVLRFSNVVIAYIIIGAVMFGGGAIPYDDIGMAKFVAGDNPDDIGTGVEDTEKAGGVMSRLNNMVAEAAGATMFGGPIMMAWVLLQNFVKFINWPIAVAISNNVPLRVTLVTAVPLTAMFYMGLVRALRTSL